MAELPYDKSNPKSIEAYAKRLVGHTFLDVLSNNVNYLQETSGINYENRKRKGGLGNLLEEVYFGYKANSDSKADFDEAGVELKTTPFEITRDGSYRAGERLVLSMISYAGPIESELINSHLWKKCKLILLVFYLRNKKLTSNLMYQIQYASLFTPPDTDLAIIESDYKTIANKIINGKAEELSESDTFYLGACTKGATAESSIVNQYYPPYTPAKKRAFCYKNSYMTYILNKYIVTGEDTYEPIISDVSELKDKSFSEYIIDRIKEYCGKTDRELCTFFDREYNNNKSQWSDLAYRMLGIKSNQAEEFVKANIKVKSVRIEENGIIKESWPLPTFKYKEIIEENWEDSDLYEQVAETKYLIVVYKKHGQEYCLKGAKLWNMPYYDVHNEVRIVWEKTVEVIKNGVKLEVNENGIKNNFPGMKDNPVAHVRTHANQSYYDLGDGIIRGKGYKTRDANELPDGRWMTNHSFWINKSYLQKLVEEYNN